MFLVFLAQIYICLFRNHNMWDNINICKISSILLPLLILLSSPASVIFQKYLLYSFHLLSAIRFYLRNFPSKYIRFLTNQPFALTKMTSSEWWTHTHTWPRTCCRVLSHRTPLQVCHTQTICFSAFWLHVFVPSVNICSIQFWQNYNRYLVP